VDLNPVRAKIATSIESSDFTSAQDRIVDAFGEFSVGIVQCSDKAEEAPSSGLSAGVGNSTCRRSENGSPDSGEKGQSGNAGSVATCREVQPGRQDLQNEVQPGRQDLQKRASNKGCLSMGLGDYLQLLDWTGRQIRNDKRGAIPKNLEPLFDRLGIPTELWVDCVVNFRKWFRSSVGRPKSMETAAESRGQNRAISISSARRAFR